MTFSFSEKKLLLIQNDVFNNLKLGDAIINFKSLEKIKCEVIEWMVCDAIVNCLISSGFDGINDLKTKLDQIYADDISVMPFLYNLLGLIKKHNLEIKNILIHISLQKPKLKQQTINYKLLIEKYLKKLFKIKKVSVQAGTGELIGEVGKSDAIVILCCATISETKKYILNGFGYDRHRFDDPESFISDEDAVVICGEKFKYYKPIHAHSDGDVVFHALVNAIFSVLSLGDIGDHFPDNDQQWKDMSSGGFVKYAIEKLKVAKLLLSKVDLQIIISPDFEGFLERENIDLEYIMIQNTAKVLEIDENCITFKARTADKHNQNRDETCIFEDDGIDAEVKIVVTTN
jgi:2-C-methyl-D-erythritol 2,4-cyclodiphosphate synthase